MNIDLIQKYLTGSGAVNLASAIEAAILDASLKNGEKLPPIRQLAKALEQSPSTVASAYKTLIQRGFLISEGRRGTRVHYHAPEALLTQRVVDSKLRDLAIGNPDIALLPNYAEKLAQLDIPKRLYDEPLNHQPLEALCRADFEAEGHRIPAIDMVAGAMDGIERVLRAGLRFTDPIAVEDPGFSGIFNLLRAMGYPLLPVEIDDRGMRPKALTAVLKAGAKAVIITPRAQNPRGSALDGPRAAELHHIMRAHPDVLVIEDDHASLVSGAPAHSICPGLPNPWVVIRSFSKALGPDLRLATMIGSETLMRRVQARQMVGMRWVSSILQSLAYALLSDGQIMADLQRAESIYSARRQFMIQALADRGIQAHGRSGMNIWVPVHDEAQMVQSCALGGYGIKAGAAYRLRAPAAIRITISTLEEAEAQALAAIIDGAQVSPLFMPSA